jgi:hypothetical protein
MILFSFFLSFFLFGSCAPQPSLAHPPSCVRFVTFPTEADAAQLVLGVFRETVYPGSQRTLGGDVVWRGGDGDVPL